MKRHLVILRKNEEPDDGFVLYYLDVDKGTKYYFSVDRDAKTVKILKVFDDGSCFLDVFENIFDYDVEEVVDAVFCLKKYLNLDALLDVATGWFREWLEEMLVLYLSLSQ